MNNYNTPYDDVFRTLLTDCSSLIIPVVNEIFHESYTGSEMVTLKENELFLKYPNKKLRKRITDSSFMITIGELMQHYHLECQSTTDGTMIIRIYEYDSQLALKEGKITGNVLEVNFPKSAILYLRHNANTPDAMVIKINTPGGTVMYDVPTLKIKTYDIETIFEKKLLFLIPFYIFTYEKQFPDIEKDEIQLEQVKETYKYVLKRLNALCEARELDEYTKRTICEMSEKVIEALTEKYEAIRKEVTEVMGGKVLNYPAKEILMRGREEGRQEGWQEGREEGREEGRQEGREEGREEGRQEGREEGREEGRQEGQQKMLLELVRKNLLQIKDAAEQIGMTEEEFMRLMEK